MRSILLTPDLEALHGTIEHLVEARHPSLLDDDNDREVSDDEWRSAEELLHEIATLQAKVPHQVRYAARRLEDDNDPGPALLQKWEEDAWRREHQQEAGHIEL